MRHEACGLAADGRLVIGVRPGAATTKQRDVVVQGSYWLVRALRERVAMRRVVAVSRACPNSRSTI
jgi:hypothetical protein